jgi:hypothetical protein
VRSMNLPKGSTLATFLKRSKGERACVFNLHMRCAENEMAHVPSSLRTWRRVMLSKSGPVFRTLVVAESISSISLSSLPFLRSLSSMMISSLPLLEPTTVELSLLMKIFTCSWELLATS